MMSRLIPVIIMVACVVGLAACMVVMPPIINCVEGRCVAVE